ncbi:MAG: hypothetical protein R3A13_03195 [Bdellovibrionota bacterium]
MYDDDPLAGFAYNDPTWKRAMKVARSRLTVDSSAWNLIKSSWYGEAETRDFIKTLSFSKLNPNCLLSAAEMNTSEFEPKAATLEQAISFLGVRLCGVVLAINLACRQVLKTKPPSLWKKLFEEMMTTIEIGYRVGSKCKEIGIEGGALIGFARGAGLSLLMAENFKDYKKWHSMTGGFENRELQIEMFGCEAYQVSAFALQVLGFGPEIALGAALGTGKLTHAHVEYPREILRWKSAFQWIECLKEGKSFPKEIDAKNFFKELVPPGTSGQNLNLESLHAEVGKVRRTGSSWNWHLPGNSYEEVTKKISEKNQN